MEVLCLYHFHPILHPSDSSHVPMVSKFYIIFNYFCLYMQIYTHIITNTQTSIKATEFI